MRARKVTLACQARKFPADYTGRGRTRDGASSNSLRKIATMKQPNTRMVQLRGNNARRICVYVFSAAAQPITELRTVAEQSDYRATARYADVMAFCKALDEGSELVTLTEFGTTHEGRALPLLVLSKKPLAGEKPWEQAKLPAILCVGNIHAGEVCGKEALLDAGPRSGRQGHAAAAWSTSSC